MQEFKKTTALLLTCILTIPVSLAASSDNQCPFSSPLPDSSVLIGYIANPEETNDIGKYRSLGILRNGQLVDSDGASINEGMELWKLASPHSPPIKLKNVSSFLSIIGNNHCVYHAELSDDLPLWTLLSSQPLYDTFKQPSKMEIDYFTKYGDSCVYQGDPHPSEEISCSRARLIMVSDINKDGIKEFWATDPYTWDTGITIWQQSPEGIKRLYSVCRGCD